MTASCVISAEIIRRGFETVTGTQTASDRSRLASALDELESSAEGVNMADALATQETSLFMASGLLRLGLPAVFVPEANALILDRALPQPLVASFVMHDGTHAVAWAGGHGVTRALGDWVDQDLAFLADRMTHEEARALAAQVRFGFERLDDDDGALLTLLTERSAVMADLAAAYQEAVEGGMAPSQAEQALANYIRDQGWYDFAIRTLVDRQGDFANRLAHPPVGEGGNLRQGWDLRLSAADMLTGDAEEGLASARLHGSYRKAINRQGELKDVQIAQDPVLATMLQTASIGLIAAETGWRQVAEWLRAMPGRESLETGFQLLTQDAEERLVAAAGSLADGKQGAGYGERIARSMHATLRLASAPSLTRRPAIPSLGPQNPGAGGPPGRLGAILPAGAPPLQQQQTQAPAGDDEDVGNW